jgi:hypothetical protein
MRRTRQASWIRRSCNRCSSPSSRSVPAGCPLYVTAVSCCLVNLDSLQCDSNLMSCVSSCSGLQLEAKYVHTFYQLTREWLKREAGLNKKNEAELLPLLTAMTGAKENKDAENVRDAVNAGG